MQLMQQPPYVVHRTIAEPGPEWLFRRVECGDGQSKTVTLYDDFPVDSFPLVCDVLRRMVEHGYHPEQKTVRVTRLDRYDVSGVLTNTQYDVDVVLPTAKGDARLGVRIRTPARTLTVAGAMSTATAVVDTIIPKGHPIAMGRGQMVAAKQLARQLWQQHSHMLTTENPLVIISCHTRGKRYGTEPKVAKHGYTLDDLLAPEPVFIMATVEFLGHDSTWSGLGKRKVTLHPGRNPQIEYRGITCAVEVNDEYATFTRGGTRMRLAMNDWQRLMGKVLNA